MESRAYRNPQLKVQDLMSCKYLQMIDYFEVSLLTIILLL